MEIKRKSIVFVILLIFLVNPFLIVNPTENQSNVRKSWEFNAGGQIYSSPCCVDLNLDGEYELLFSNYNGYLYCLDHEGKLLWRFNADTILPNPPIVVDLDSNGYLEILVGDINGIIHYINYDGTEKWTFEAIGDIVDEIVIADLDFDGNFEIIFTSFQKKAYCLDKFGRVEWIFNTSGFISSSPVVANVIGNNELEVFFGASDGLFYCLNNSGQVVWQKELGGADEISTATIVDLFEYEKYKILIPASGIGLVCLNNDGSYNWTYNSDRIISEITVADIDRDGEVEEIFCDGYELVSLSNTGSVEWESFQTGLSQFVPSVCDLNKDSNLEIFVKAGLSNMQCYSNLGMLEWSYSPNEEVVANAIICDLNNNGFGEIIFCTWEGAVICLEEEEEKIGSNRWYCSRGSNFNSGFIDSDGDYLDDLFENHYNTSKHKYDTDGDFYSDWQEIFADTDPNNQFDYPFYPILNLTIPNTAPPETLLVGKGKTILLIGLFSPIIIIISTRKKKLQKQI